MGAAVSIDQESFLRLRGTRWAPLICISFAVFVDYLIYGALVPLAPHSPATSGGGSNLPVLYGVYSIGVLFSTPAFGAIADRFGYGAVMRLSVGLSVPAILLLWHSNGFTLTLIGRLFQGAASASTWTAGLALVAARYQRQRVRMIGLTLMASTGGSVIGPVMSGTLYQIGGYALPFVVLCAFAMTDAVLRFLLLPPDPPHEPGAPGPIRLLSDRSIAAPALTVAIAAGAWGILEPTLPRHLEHAIGMSAAEIGLMFTLSAIVYGLMSPLVSSATGRFGMASTVVAGIIAMAAMLPLLGLTPNPILTGIVLCIVNAVFAFLLNPTSAELGDAVERRGLSCYGAVYAVYNIAYAIGMMTAAALGASLSERVSTFQILLCASVVLLACIPVILGASRKPRAATETP